MTYSYIWSARKNGYETLYEETRTSVQAQARYGSYLKAHPTVRSSSLVAVDAQESLKVIKHFEKVVMNNGQKKIENYFLVQNAQGVIGYLPANYITFQSFFHANTLDAFYQKAPLVKNDWRHSTSFVEIEGKRLTGLK